MKLNYRPYEDKKENDIRSETKLSMQSLVNRALASKMPTNPVQPAGPSAPTGWGKTSN